jgi:hypothetical protein
MKLRLDLLEHLTAAGILKEAARSEALTRKLTWPLRKNGKNSGRPN